MTPDAYAYLAAHNVEARISAAVRAVLSERPTDPVAAIGRKLLSECEYAEAVRYTFANADFSGIGARYKNPRQNWDRFDQMLELLGQPLSAMKVVHIAGTNGKGTTSALCEAMLRASGVGSVGLFTSPHLHCFRERIRVDGRLVSKEAIVTAMRKVRPVVERLGYASPFEKLTALALECFRAAGAEWVVLETGLGGRWDCTNHCRPLVTGITRIGMDHMNVLGSTIDKIAGEKAGILKAGVPAFCVPQHADAMAVLKATADEVGAPLGVSEAVSPSAPPGLPLWLSPRHQQHNAAMALAMMEALSAHGHLSAPKEAWSRARETVVWPARFEILRPAPMQPSQALVIDVAHNEPAVAALLASVAAKWPDAPLVVIFGANFDKDVSAIVSLLCAQPKLCRGIAVQSSHPKAVPATQILDACAGQGSASEAQGALEHAGWEVALSMREALQQATAALAGDHGQDGRVLCCGSVFVAADMRAMLAREQPQLFATDDWVFDEAGEPALLM